MSNLFPIILDFDGSVMDLPGARRIALGHHQETIRFGCLKQHMQSLQGLLEQTLPPLHGPVFLGSGDFHHVSYALIRRLGMRQKTHLEVVVFDNHPDNMRFPWGIHCGSWVRHMALLPFVRHVHIVGITSKDVSSLFGQYFTPLWRKKLTYWFLGAKTWFAPWLGIASAFKCFQSPREMLEAFYLQIAKSNNPLYLSIDKDVLSQAIAKTNWDQGLLRDHDLIDAIAFLKRRIIASDITGEVSAYVYKTWWKRLLSTLDGQKPLLPTQVKVWQVEQHGINERLAVALCQP